MLDTAGVPASIKNKVLMSLPSAEYNFLQRYFERIQLSRGDIVYEAGDSVNYVYFPNSGMISLLSVTEQGQGIEIGFTGSEGLVGLPLLLKRDEMPYQALTQAPTDAIRVESKFVSQLFNRRGRFHDIVLRYFYVVLKQISQTCVCNHFHRIEARLCRWLAVMSERAGDKHLVLTQEFLAQMLGVQRTSIGMIAGTLQSEKIIRYRRGKIEILDYERLKSSACECYEIIRREQHEFISDKIISIMSDI